MDVKKILLGSILFTAAVHAGTIITTDGRSIEGDLKKTPEGWNVTAADGTVTSIPTSRVKSFVLTNNNAAGAMEKLYSLRRSVEAMDDIPKIIERYKRFIDQVRDQSTLDEANKDLAAWQEKLNQSLVKVGREWITVEERKNRVVESVNKVVHARDQIKAGHLADAARLIDEIQVVDPNNLSAFYLEGVIDIKQDKLGEAKKNLVQVQQSLNDHAPTLMNLAIINARQKQWTLAAGQAELALSSSPGVQILLDNSAELYNALPDDLKKSAAGQKLLRKFTEQDEQLQSRMADKQLYRWGSKWVDKETRDKLAAADTEVKKRLDELQGDFDLTQNRITRIDSQVNDNVQSMNNMAASSYTRLSDGKYVQLPLPESYYELERDNNKLKAEKQEMLKRLDSLRDAAKRAKQQLPVPRYSGVLQPINEDGVPIVLPAGVNVDLPTTQPETTDPRAPTTQAKEEMIIKIGPAEEEGK